ncbi:MAG TPA: DUF3843 family protein [Bacteroidales bacterium]|nr:DUF3843 family protein [Bacteroidales bacterium]
MKNRIYIQDWLELKPYAKPTAVDDYYLKLSNDVQKVIATDKKAFALQMFLDKEQINLLSCFLTSYFEDLISGTNIWNSFVRMHHRLYGKQLPFYNLDEYYEEEINAQDVSFLICYFINSVQEEKFYSPFSSFITEAAEKIYELFDKEWEYAPENEYLKTFYQIDPQEKEYYVARKLIDRVLFDTYLFYPDTSLRLQEQISEIFENKENDDDVMMYIHNSRDGMIFRAHTRLLALKGQVWVAEILGSNHPLHQDFLDISNKILGLFLYKGQDDNNIFIEHIASGKKFNMTKKSFERSHVLTEVDTIMFLGIVRWQGEWWFSGTFFKQSFDPDVILEEKSSMESRSVVNFLDYPNPEIDEILRKQILAFKNYNNDSLIAFLPSDKIEEFYKGYMEFYNETLNLSEKEVRKAKQRLKNDGFIVKETHKDFSEIAETGLVFFNQKGGVEIGLGVNSAFPLPSNPYFKEEDSEEDVMFLLMHESLSKELVLYCIEHCKSRLSFFADGVGKRYLEDFDFLLRFWKKGNYHTVPSITIAGKD